MKKITAILILAILVFVSGRHILFRTYVSSQKSHFRKLLLKTDRSDCLQIVVPSGELFKDHPGFEWKEKNKELVINGKYHEVLDVVIRSGSATIYLVPDKQENELFANYLRLNDDTSKPFSRLLHFMLALTFTEPEPGSLNVDGTGKDRLFGKEIAFSTSQFHSKIPKPPMGLI